MERRIAGAIAGVVWVSALASAAALSYVLRQPTVVIQEPRTSGATRAADTELRPTSDEKNVSSVLEVPTVIIYGDLPPRRGIAEMQGASDVIIGPGVVTHPER